ncbi:2-dehydropantoate 2-reductase [Formosa sediminum]|uniref:2-dehydropantoate 2-reductase n=1 Tax=Formosa sediminum TaxID=2594004 RepID=A0A516GQV3_9FLAO|nr:2-dehydropantoate 2-reductase [Formosa sediminum]QDO93898.1 2-dehydropantoate 2-reductase [Formosa sediminum]
MDKKHIVIIGLGGVGGYFGFKINQVNGSEKNFTTTFVARGQTYKTVKQNGLRLLSSEHINTVTHPNAICETISKIATPDLVLICVKEYDLEHVCQQLSEVITPNTIVLPIMNGVDITDRIRTKLPHSTILPSCVYVTSHIKETGVIEQKGFPGKLIFSEDQEHLDTNLDWVLNVLKTSEINFEFKTNAQTDIWTKFMFVASFGLITAKYNSSIGAVCTDKKQKEEAIKIMQEISLIADLKKIHLNDYTIENLFEKAATFPPDTATSLQLDINSGKDNNELELFAGAIINYGKIYHVNTPCTAKIYNDLLHIIN